MKNVFLIFISMSLLTSCSSTKNKNSVVWVSGIKTECSNGVGKMNCLNVHRGNDLNNPNWENFYAPIEGFNFEEGFLKKIELKEVQLNPKNVPADASSIKYTLVKELDKKPDNRLLVQGNWVVNSINNNPINKMVVLPTMKINLTQKLVSGNGGCNSYSGIIKKITEDTINFGSIASTLMACVNKNIEGEYHKALETVNTYQIESDNLIFYNKTGEKIISYMKQEESNSDLRLHDIWTAIRINNNPINRMSPSPSMEINLKEKQVMGNDGCNNYSGVIKNISNSKITFGNIASTRKMCRKMEIPNSFNKALNNVSFFKLDGLNLILMDAEKKEVLAFLKSD